ncbi:hypothetical protein EBZ37_10985, partial [bacterium]|nr:hypothetical protein [bacterium]
ACGRGLDDQEEYAQAVGDVMSSMDESSGPTSGGYAQLQVPVRLKSAPSVLDFLIPEAQAASCLLQTFSGTCPIKTRSFGGCTLAGGRATLTGSVTLTFTDGSCSLSSAGNSVTRTADFTISAPRGSLTVSSPVGGQTVTRTDSGFTYSVGGMKRVLKNSDGETVADIETKTLSAISVSGANRATRVMNGGQLEIKNLTREACFALRRFVQSSFRKQVSFIGLCLIPQAKADRMKSSSSAFGTREMKSGSDLRFSAAR